MNPNDLKKLKQERQQIFNGVYSNKIPKRVPINVSLTLDVIAGYANINRKDALWNPNLVEISALELGEKIFSDVCLFGGNPRVPSSSQAMGSINSVMGSTGLMQHPNVVGLYPEEYSIFIEDPYACIVDTILPRLYREMDVSIHGGRSFFAVAQGINAKNEHLNKIRGIMKKMSETYGYYTSPIGANGAAYACMDFIADNIRSFSGMSSDIRRVPEKVLKACEALYPYNYKMGLPAVIHHEGSVFFPLHMPTFMRKNDFEKLWWPTFKQQVDDYASIGVHTKAFCEGNWMRYLDYLQDLPTDTRLQFEYGDAKVIKEKLGSKFILTGLFPLSTLTNYNKQQCIYKTKEFLDIMAPGGKFIFGFDKSPLVFTDINIENLIAVCDTVRDYGFYDNAGQQSGFNFNKNDYKHSALEYFSSKYYRTWEEYKNLNPETPHSAINIVGNLEDHMLKFVYGLLL
ncbi:MAG: uroporphyrinogen decarboxylase [Eubacteriales bacterium]